MTTREQYYKNMLEYSKYVSDLIIAREFDEAQILITHAKECNERTKKTNRWNE